MTPQQKYKSPLSIPEGKIGEYAIEHEIFPAGHEFSTAYSMRNRMLGGQEDTRFSWPHPVTVHRLRGPTGVWMTDLPVEQAQIQKCIRGMRGRILVGGLGLGLAASLLAAKKSVKEVCVVEISEEVIQLVQPHLERTRAQCGPIVVATPTCSITSATFPPITSTLLSTTFGSRTARRRSSTPSSRSTRPVRAR